MPTIEVWNRPNDFSNHLVSRMSKFLLEIILQCDELSDVDGAWKFIPVRHIRWRSNSRFSVLHIDRSSITVKARPESNDTSWQLAIYPPSGLALLLAGRVLSLWNGWTGVGVPDAYVASCEKHEDVQVTKKEPVKQAIETAPEPVKTPAPKVASSGFDIAKMFTHLSERVSRSNAIREQMAVLKDENERVVREADLLLQKSDEISGKIRSLQKELEDPDMVAAMAAVESFSKVIGG